MFGDFKGRRMRALRVGSDVNDSGVITVEPELKACEQGTAGEWYVA
jgi:hypothetical protein